MRLHDAPRSKAKTAWGLLADIRRVVLAEPKRYNQGTWGETQLSPDQPIFGEMPAPACGTRACVAGWVRVLTRGSVPARQIGLRFNYTSEKAAEILGLNYDQRAELFAGGAVPGNPGTANHARKGAAHIRRFMRKYEKQLRAHRIAATPTTV